MIDRKHAGVAEQQRVAVRIGARYGSRCEHAASDDIVFSDGCKTSRRAETAVERCRIIPVTVS